MKPCVDKISTSATVRENNVQKKILVQYIGWSLWENNGSTESMLKVVVVIRFISQLIHSKYQLRVSQAEFINIPNLAQHQRHLIQYSSTNLNCFHL